MAENFDAYHRWLGIPPEQQPPNHYRLLGLERFETDPEVIEAAADRQMVHLRSYQSGKRAEHSQRLLNEISAAKVCLLDKQKKAKYDARLKAESDTDKKVKQEKPLRQAQPLSGTPAAAAPAAAAAAEPAERAPAGSAAASSPAAASAPMDKQASSGGAIAPLLVALIGGGIFLVLLAAGGVALLMLGWWSASAPPPQPEVAFTVSSNNVPEEDPAAVEDPDPPKPTVVRPPPNRPPVKPPVRPEDPPPEEIDNPQPPEEEEVEPAGEDAVVEPSPPPVVAPPEPVDDRLPIPEKAQREKKAEQIREIFPVDEARTYSEKTELARKLISTARETNGDPAAQFALLNMAREMACSAGDVRLAFQAVDGMDQRFQVKGNDVRIDCIAKAARASAPTSARRDMVRLGIELVDELFEDDEYVEAGKLIAGLTVVARTIRERDQLTALAERKKLGSELFSGYREAQEAIETLKEKPDDQEANLVAGRFYALVKGDWQRGLPMLAAGSDEKLAALAKREMAVPGNAEEEKALADGWYELAGSSQGVIADRQMARAGMWYRRARALLSGLSRIEVEKRVEEIAEVELSGGKRYEPPAASVATATPTELPTADDTIDLLALVDVAKDSANGAWRRDGKHIVSPTNYLARLALPVIPPPEYTLDLVVSCDDPALDLTLGLVASGTQFSANIEGFNQQGSDNSISGLGDIDGKRPPVNESVKHGRFSRPGKPNHIQCEVRDSVIRVKCNDDIVTEWRGNHSRLTRSDYMRVDDKRILFLGTHGHEVTFHSATLTPITGETKLLRGEPAAAKASTPAAAAASGRGGEREVDLLPLIDLGKDRLRGNWNLKDGNIVCPKEYFTRLQVPYVPPSEYDLEAVIHGPVAGFDVWIQLPLAGTPVAVILEGFGNRDVSGIEMIDGRRAASNETARKGKFFRTDGPNKVNIAVRERSIEVECNGKTITQWSGDPDRLSESRAGGSMPNPRAIYLGGYGREWSLAALKIKPVQGEGKLLRSAAGTSNGADAQVYVNLLERIDINKNVFGGRWRFEEGTLVCPPGAFTRVQIPYHPPEAYTLEVEATRLEGSEELAIGLIYQDHPCHVALDRYGGKQTDLMVDMRTDSNGVARWSGHALPKGRRCKIVCDVRKDHLRVSLDGKPLLTYRGRPNWNGRNEFWRVPDNEALLIGAHRSRFHIHSIKLIPLAAGAAADGQGGEEEVVRDLTPRDRDVDLLAHIDLDEDKVKGEWQFAGGALVSPQGEHQVLRLPCQPPRDFRLDMEITRVAGDGALGFHIPHGGHATMHIDEGKPHRSAWLINGRGGDRPRVDGTVLRKGRRTKLSIVLEREGCYVEVDGRRLMGIAGRPGSWSNQTKWNVKPGTFLGIGADETTFHIHSMKLTPLSEGGQVLHKAKMR